MIDTIIDIISYWKSHDSLECAEYIEEKCKDLPTGQCMGWEIQDALESLLYLVKEV